MQSTPIDIKDNGSEQQISIQGICFTMKKVEGGSFLMGAQKKDKSGLNYDEDEVVSDDESPVHPLMNFQACLIHIMPNMVNHMNCLFG